MEHIHHYFQSAQEKAIAAKGKGNKYFKGGKYEQAIACYTDAIELCPPQHKNDISTFYQNRAAAHEQLVGWKYCVEIVTSMNSRFVFSDCVNYSDFDFSNTQVSMVTKCHQTLWTMYIICNEHKVTYKQ